ncbi:MAG: Gfo/Idh/MocA family oxidoreductase [SAR202 cluster bacterium]|nr:Gfo/Idh/MocA family oxidoreductase [SAR202 cluster bacterium]|tara:strand:- start:9732 stop:10769 length:1038 start_codon:yes stop_codon:yes gene_type:complete
MTDNIRIALIGAGANTKLKHIPGFQSIDGVEIVSVTNRSIASSQAVADEYDIPNVIDNWIDVVESPENDAICIGTWPYMHHPMVLMALECNKHVLTEARMAMNSVEAQEMLTASKINQDLITQIVPAPITFKIDKTVKRLLSENAIGDLLSVDLNISLNGFIENDSLVHWRQIRDFSGNNIMALGIWYETLMRWIGEASSVTALTRVNVKSRKTENGENHVLTIPDHLEILCEMYSGPLTHIRMSNVTGLAPSDSAWLFGTEGTLFIDLANLDVYLGKREDSKLEKLDIPKNEMGDWRVEEEFINAIRGNELITHTSFEDGVRYMEFTDAVLLSSQSGKKIKLPF